MVLFDYGRSTMFNIEVVSIDHQPAEADGKTPVNIKVKLTGSNNRLVQGHDLYALSQGGGNFRTNRIRTDSNGEADFIYYPYMASTIQKVKNVPIEIMDESNSIFVEINATKTFELKMIEPEKKAEQSEITMQSIFGEGDSKNHSGGEDKK